MGRPRAASPYGSITETPRLEATLSRAASGLVLLAARPWIRVHGAAPLTLRLDIACDRRRHELRPDRIRDGARKDRVDLAHGVGIDAPAHDLTRRRELIGPSRTPQRHAAARPVEHPPQRQVDDPLAEALSRKAIERLDRLQVLGKTRRAEFRIAAAQVVAREGGVG